MAAGRGDADSREALEQLCGTYWYPLYAYVRRRGYDPAEAQDLTQDFFAHLLEHDSLRVADQRRGRFRTFLLSSLQNFLAKHWRAGQAAKRGGGRKLLSLDFEQGEARFQVEPTNDRSPEVIFERRWAMTLLSRALERLCNDYSQSGKAALFDALKLYLGGGDDRVPYREIAEQLGMTEGAVKVAAYRIRQRCRELLREEIAQTVAGDEEIDEELRELFAAVTR